MYARVRARNSDTPIKKYEYVIKQYEYQNFYSDARNKNYDWQIFHSASRIYNYSNPCSLKISTISAGVTTIGLLGKCFLFPVTK